jgi:hypothetical protein
MGGMFGVIQNTLARKKASQMEFTKIIEDFGPYWSRGIDEEALSRIVFPRAIHDSLVHDSYHCNSLWTQFLK